MNLFEKLEIVDFYPIFHLPLEKAWAGTLHVYFPNLDMDLRGVFISRDKKGGWRINLPNKSAYDPEVKKKIAFPVLTFTNRETHKTLEKQILKAAQPFILDKLPKIPRIEKRIKVQKKKTSFNEKPNALTRPSGRGEMKWISPVASRCS